MLPDVSIPSRTTAEWRYFPELLERAVPRYTSYPTAVDFIEGDFAAAHAAALQELRGAVSLYLHIPYCEQICWYCGCNTGAANKTQRLAAYLEALNLEIEMVGRNLHPSVRVTRIAFGGGSPNAIKPTDFVRLIDRLTLNLHLATPVISVEIDPRGLTDEWLLAMRGIGVTKASLGVQTLDPKVQCAIGRVQPRDSIERAANGLRKAGINSINFDLMYGLPFQDDAVLADTIDNTIAMGADRIALFGYAHVPHLIPRQQRIDASRLPDQRARFGMAAQGHARLTAAGYEAVGFDHFALPGDDLAIATRNGTLRRNFQGFTDDQAPALIGLGASSISDFPGLFVQNEKNAGRYRTALSSGQLTGHKGVVRNADDRRRGAIIEGLLCRGRANIDSDLLEASREHLQPFVDRGLAGFDSAALVLHPGSEPYARSIAAIFDGFRSPTRTFSSAI